MLDERRKRRSVAVFKSLEVQMPWSKRLAVLALLLLTPFIARSQNPAPAPDTAGEQLLSSKQLDALVAPIALYPDPLLAQVLMASTYPLEVVQADRWAKDNDKLQGDRLKGEVENQRWDDSVKSLVATPSVLTMMNTKLDWTQKLGDAVLAQQADVMDAIQRLRSKAYGNKKLTSTNEQKVTVKQTQNREVIAIEPTDPQTVYVPYYDPAVVYGEWPYPDYPPYYYYPEPGYIGSAIIATGIAFGTAYALGRWALGGRYWGGRINWGGGQININRGAHVSHWQHNPQHRRGVGYNNPRVQQRFGNSVRAGNKAQPDFRGRTGEKVLNPGGARSNVGEHRAADRVKGGDRARGNQISQAHQRSSRPNQPVHQRAARNVHPVRSANRPAHRRSASIPRGGAGYAAPRMGRHVGGRGGSRGGRGGRRSDVALKHDIVLLGRLDNGLGFYRFAYNGANKIYVGVLAQEVQEVMPEAVLRGRDGYLRVRYDQLGLRFQTYRQWLTSGAQIPVLDTLKQSSDRKAVGLQ
jgi:Protein of unknown function (DUF3300)